MLEAIKIIFLTLLVVFNITVYVVGIYNLAKWLLGLERKNEEEQELKEQKEIENKFCEECEYCLTSAEQAAHDKKTDPDNFSSFTIYNNRCRNGVLCSIARGKYDYYCGLEGKYFKSIGDLDE